MPVAFVFINAETGAEDEIMKELRRIPEIKEAYAVYGVYDIVAKVEAEAMDKLRETIARKVRKVDGIRSTLTMVAMEGR
jgi:DNA-binding Lrp family transcriptional regulator